MVMRVGLGAWVGVELLIFARRIRFVMRSARLLRNAFLALAVLAAPVAAQDPAEPLVIDPEANLVGALVVVAADRGPAWWKLTDADSTIWILGVPQGGLPRSVKWDTIGVERRLNNAKQLLLPPDYGGTNIFSLVFFMFFNRDAFESQGRTLEPSLPPELRVRYVKVRNELGVDAKQVERWEPFLASMVLSSQFQRPLGFDRGEPLDKIRSLARRARVKQDRIAGYDFMPAIRTLAAAPAKDQLECLDVSLDQIEAGREPLLTAARGWADGDLKAALSAERGTDRCLAVLPGISAFTQRVMADTSAAIVKALDTPGKTVVVVELRPLLAETGVLQRLKARGLEVVSPASAHALTEEDAPLPEEAAERAAD